MYNYYSRLTMCYSQFPPRSIKAALVRQNNV